MAEVERYFIAIIPPDPLRTEATLYKQYFAEHYNSKAALNSPPHVTLHMPFNLKAKKENELIERLRDFGKTQNGFTLDFNGFDCFVPRVIFVRVEPSLALTAFESSLLRFCKTQFQLFNARYQDRPFHPHLTVAFRDLGKQEFAHAWEEFKSKPIAHTVLIKSFHLLRHDGAKWTSIAELTLGD